jgi:hypothetical protein
MSQQAHCTPQSSNEGGHRVLSGDGKGEGVRLIDPKALRNHPKSLLFDVIGETYRRRLHELEDTQQAAATAMTKVQHERNQAKVTA